MKTATKDIDPNQTTIEDLKGLIRDAESMLADVGGAAGDKAGEMRERMRAALAEGRNVFKKVREQTRERALEADEYVRSHPYQVIGLAAGVGAIVGLLVARRN